MRKIVVTLGAINALAPVEKVARIREIKTTCDASASYKASSECQVAMTVWLDKATALEKKHAARKAKEAELQTLIDEEELCILDCDAAGSVFGATAESTAKGDPTVATGMGLPVRGGPEFVSEVGLVTGVNITAFKKTGAPRLAWDETAGAVLYRAEMTVEPATETSWTILYGNGKSRKIPPLIRGQRYSFRVCALGADGKASPWSATVSFVAE